MISELAKLLQEGRVIFFISGQSVKSINWRIVDHLPKNLRKNILVGHCSGCEVWGYDKDGNQNKKPYYSYYEDKLTTEHRKQWRIIMDKIIQKFGLIKYETMPISEFAKRAETNPLAIMYEDRGPQITFEVINGYDLDKSSQAELNKRFNFQSNDLRDVIIREAEILLKQNNIPINARKAGVFAVDFAIHGVSKTTAVKRITENTELMKNFDINPNNIEELLVLGDKFSLNGGTDRHISEALNPNVLSITFRRENPNELPVGYNIQIWDGKNELHHGALEFLQAR